MKENYSISITIHKSLIDEEMKKNIQKIKEHFQKRNIKMTTEKILENAIEIGIKWHIKEQLQLLSN